MVIGGIGAPLGAQPVILKPGAMVEGKSLGEWANAWWQYVMAIPLRDPETEEILNPLFDLTGRQCARGQSGPVFFLVGLFGGSVVRDLCVVPPGKRIFFPVVNSIGWSVGLRGSTCGHNCSEAMLAHERFGSLSSNVDGFEIPDVASHLEGSPVCFDIVVPPGAIGDIVPDTYPESCTFGHYLMLEPLDPGLHVIRFSGTRGDPSDPAFVLDVTYLLTVASTFRRGDTDGAGVVDLSDAIAILGGLFLGAPRSTCADAEDVNDDGKVDIADPVLLLEGLFRGAAVPLPGLGDCGDDPTPDDLPACVFESGVCS